MILIGMCTRAQLWLTLAWALIYLPLYIGIIPRAHAQSAASLRCEDSATCAELYKKALSLSRAGSNEDALRLYQAAYKVRADPRLLYNAGRILHRTGRPGEAVTYYQRVLDSGINVGDIRPKATEYLAQAQAEISQLPKVAGTLSLANSPSTSSAPPIPVYKRPWFWAVIGVAGAAVIGGVVAGVVVRLTPPRGTQPFEQQP